MTIKIKILIEYVPPFTHYWGITLDQKIFVPGRYGTMGYYWDTMGYYWDSSGA